ncbi:glycoside hydrolase family 2 TIM barrel-domain containing protein [Natronospora cellulosivora (SeqCode)]
MNKKTLFNDGWEFAKSELGLASADGLEFKAIDIPHDWLIYNTLDLYENSIGWYRKKFNWNKEADEVLLYFDGVYMDSTLYVNGEFVGEWKYGYSSFEHDITDSLQEGENEILLKVVHQSPNSRWYSGAGIYRNVWLKTRGKDHIVTDGIYLSTKKTDNSWQVEIDTELDICNDVELVHSIFYNEQLLTSSKKIVKGKGSNLVDQQVLEINDPELWGPDEPNLYQLTTDLYIIKDLEGDQIREKIESITQNIGFKDVLLDPDRGFMLNGKKIKLNGVCEHHDLGALGAAFNKYALKRRFKILKDMGVNAIRTAHNMPAKELMDLADEMGLLVVSEAFDMWERPKTEYDYARFFNDWAAKDVERWVKRDRNHPSLIMWSIGNEVYDTHAGERGQEITRMLMDFVLKYDPKENGKVTFGSNYMPWENTQKCADIIKIPGYNYAEKYYEKHHAEHPDWVIYGSETASVVQSRGVYHFPYQQSILADDDEQCSALGNSSTSWGADSPEACIVAERDTPFSLGQFLWTGFDYIGEPTPYHTKNSYFGQIDTATFKKDPYYIYQAGWTDYKENPMVYIFPYWDFSKGQIIDVRVCSNAPKVELQLNGESIGTYDIDHENGKADELVAWWKIPYQEGELKALAYDEKGNLIATDIRKSFGDAKKISLKADKEQLIANGQDLIFVEISMEDEDGNIVENANNRVHVQVSGAGRLVGLDNGDSTDYDQYKGLSRRLFSGKLMAIIAATFETGKIQIEVFSQGMESEILEFQAQESNEYLKGISAITSNTKMPIVMGSDEEIPLRKIELISELGQVFNESRKEMTVKAKLYPENTSFQELEWAVVNDAGIESNIATVEANGTQAKIAAMGDGEFRLRCMSKNGTEKVKLISELEFKAEGLGTAYKDPYGFITAGLFDYSKGEISNGNEKGIATGRDEVTVVGFRDIDFGAYGSDTISIPIFALNDEEYTIEIWEGMPEEESSELLDTVIYQKESKWNVYQEETYRLPKRLKGIASLCFVLKEQKVHIKGFSFEKQNPAFEKNLAKNCDHIYGDNFTITEKAVEGIGNNVSLEFEEMDFGNEGASRLVISGNSSIDKNTIHVRFDNEEGQDNQIIEFAESDGYQERVIDLDKVRGKQKVTFVFLPGSNFDFAYFRFER